MMGHSTHGVRLLPLYIKDIEEGNMNVSGSTILRKTLSVGENVVLNADLSVKNKITTNTLDVEGYTAIGNGSALNDNYGLMLKLRF